MLYARFDAALAHRGPDASGRATYLRDGAPCGPDAAELVLLHRRLAIIDLDADIATLKQFKARGIIGAAINPTFYGNDFYRHASGLIKRLSDLAREGGRRTNPVAS